MNNKYLVIDQNGNIHDPRSFAESPACPSEFRVVIEREALGLISGLDKQSNPSYLNIANKLGFKWEPCADVGFLEYDHKADLIMRLVEEYARQLVNGIGLPIYEVKGSNFFDLDYPVVAAYAGLFGDRLFQYHNNGKDLVMSYDASYPQFNLASRARISDAALPFAHFSISDCYRFEQSGECMLLFRGRRFFMPDLHPYFRDIAESFEWYFKLEVKLLEAAAMAKRQFWNVIKVSSLENWEEYREEIIKIAVKKRSPALVEIRRDGVERYWIIDVDYSIVDSFSQVREIGCIQIDVGNAERLGIKYLDNSGAIKHPVIIHAAIPGGIERFIYMLCDQFKNSFPFWLHPVQVRLLPVSKKQLPFVLELAQKFGALNLRFEIDDRNEPLGKRIKRVHEDLVPGFIVIGDKEIAASAELELQLRKLAELGAGYPFLRASWPILKSAQIK